MIDIKWMSNPCSLCSALEGEIEKACTTDEAEREYLLRFLLRGHKEACHGPR